MLRWYKEQYDNGREREKLESFIPALNTSLSDQGIRLSEDKLKKLLLIVFVELSCYLNNNVDKIVDMDDMVLYRDSDLDNLLVLQKKEKISADEVRRRLYEYYLPKANMDSIMSDYLTKVTSDLDNTEERLSRLQNTINQRKGEC